MCMRRLTIVSHFNGFMHPRLLFFLQGTQSEAARDKSPGNLERASINSSTSATSDGSMTPSFPAPVMAKYNCSSKCSANVLGTICRGQTQSGAEHFNECTIRNQLSVFRSGVIQIKMVIGVFCNILGGSLHDSPLSRSDISL